MPEGLTCAAVAALLSDVNLLNLSSQIGKVLLVLVGFSVVVFAHELGHFLAARWAGVRVDKFAIGFGKELAGFTRGKTRYCVNLLPLGGYVKMLGQEDFAVDKSGEWKVKEDPDSFTNKPVGKRMVIVSAGVVMNVIFAALLFMFVFMVGIRTLSPRVGLVVPQSPADLAGFQTGDEIVRVNGRKIADFEDLLYSIVLSERYEKLNVELRRDGQTIRTQVIPEVMPGENRPGIGVSPGLTNRIAVLADAVNVPGQPQLQPADLIVKVGDQDVGENDFHLVWRALLSAAGRPVKLTVERPLDPHRPDGRSERKEVFVRAPLTLLPQVRKDEDTVHFLGLVPRRQIVNISPGGRGEIAGLRADDVVVQWGEQAHPTYGEITNTIDTRVERDIRATVLRDGELVNTVVRPTLTGRWWRTREPKVGVSFQGIEEGARRREQYRGLVVAAILDTVQGEPTPAAALLAPSADGTEVPMQRGALLLSADGRELDSWLTLIEVCQSRSRQAYLEGQGHAEVAVSYLNPGATQPCTRLLRVPVSLRAAMGLDPAARVSEIAGQRTVFLKNDVLADRPVSVQFWLAAKQVLREHAGETIQVKYFYLGESGEHTAQFNVPGQGVDTWDMRTSFDSTLLGITPDPITKMLVADGPVDALWIGVRKTAYVITQAYLTFRRMVFDRTVGVENISGPVGIVKLGSDVLEAGVVKLIYFLALISANLAVINFLPLPIMDGGLMVFLIIEKIKGSPISLKTQVVTQLIGLALIIAAFLFVTIMDISKLTP